MGKLVQDLKKTGRAAKKAGRKTANATKWTTERWRGLLPLLCMAGIAVTVGVVHLVVWIADTWEPWVGFAALAVVAFVWADGWVGQTPRAHQRCAGALLGYVTVYTVVLTVFPQFTYAWWSLPVVGLALGTWWWNGGAYQSYRAADKLTAFMYRVLAKLRVSDDTKVTSVKTNAKGDVEWALYLGDHDRPDQIKAADIAHMLKTDVSRVVVRRAKKGSTRSMKVVWLAADPAKSIDPVHPAVRVENRQPGGAWEPGTRSVLDGFVTGWQLAAAVHAVARILTTKGRDVRHIGFLGATGSGKTSTVSGLLLSAIACRDLVVGVADVAKAGNLGLPFAGALHRIATTIDELEADIDRLNALGTDRIRRMNDGEVLGEDGKKLRKWAPSKRDPLILYIIDELGNTMRNLSVDDPMRATQLWDNLVTCIQNVRQAGIVLAYVSQDAKEASINSTFRKAIGDHHHVHRVATPQCVNGINVGRDIDMFESGLPDAGMHWSADVDGGDPAKSMGFNMDELIEEETQIAAAVDDFAATRPFLSNADVAILGWGDALCVIEGASTYAEDAETPENGSQAPGSVSTALDVMASALDGPEIPEGVRLDLGDTDASDADVERMNHVLAVLATADKPLPRKAVETEIGLSTSKTKDLLAALVRSGRVERVGVGRESVYRIATVPVPA